MKDRESLLDKRIVSGYLFTWGNRNFHGEKFLKGAFAKSIQEHGPDSGSNYRIKFLYNHQTGAPLALFRVLKEDDYGLYFETEPLDDVPEANRTLIQLRSGTLNNFSGGFRPVWDKAQWDESDDSIVYAEVNLLEGSVVAVPSDLETYAVRSEAEVNELFEEIEDFIDTLPRKFRLEARHLFASQKALIITEPLTQIREALSKGDGKPRIEKKATIDVDYILSNIKF